jgi:hypothetical protein
MSYEEFSEDYGTKRHGNYNRDPSRNATLVRRGKRPNWITALTQASTLGLAGTTVLANLLRRAGARLPGEQQPFGGASSLLPKSFFNGYASYNRFFDPSRNTTLVPVRRKQNSVYMGPSPRVAKKITNTALAALGSLGALALGKTLYRGYQGLRTQPGTIGGKRNLHHIKSMSKRSDFRKRI